MSISRPFAYNTGASIAGTEQVGNLAVGTPTSGFTGMEWWNGPNELLGWVIAESVSGDTQPTPISGVTASVGFFRTPTFTDSSFISLANKITNQSYTTATQASSGLTSLGYWNSYSETWPSTDIRFIGRTQTTTAAPLYTFTFNSVNIGSASTIYQSLIVIVVESHDTSSILNIDSVSVSGLSATLAVRPAANLYTTNAIYYLPWTSQTTTANIIVTLSNPLADGCSIAIYRLDNVRNATPIQTNSNSTFTSISNLSYSWTFTGLSVGDLVIAATTVENLGGATISWTGLTENYDVSYDSLVILDSGASTRITTSGDTTFTRAISLNVSNTIDTVSAVWR